MGIDIGGATIVMNAGGGVTLNTALVFDAAGRGHANNLIGYSGSKSGGQSYYGAPTGWEINSSRWQSGLNMANGIFTCPVAGIYALGYSGIHRGGGNTPVGLNTYGYFGFAKNGALSYWVHCNQATPATAGGTSWHSGGGSTTFSCAAGDTLALMINRSPPLPAIPADVYSQNYGLYPSDHHAVWCRLVG